MKLLHSSPGVGDVPGMTTGLTTSQSRPRELELGKGAQPRQTLPSSVKGSAFSLKSVTKQNSIMFENLFIMARQLGNDLEHRRRARAAITL